MKSFTNFCNWIFITNYRYTYLKKNNPEFKVIGFNSFIYANLIIFLINLFCVIFGFRAIKPYWYVIIYIIVYLINHFYYYTLEKKNSINIPPNKNDLKFLYILFFTSVFLNFFSYYYVIENTK